VLFLLRSSERGKEPHAGKHKLRNDIAERLRAVAPGARMSFDVGRVYVESEDDLRAELEQLHGVSSFSPCSLCDVADLERHVLGVAAAVLTPPRSFRLRIRRAGQHPFSSKSKAAELGAAILAHVPGCAVDLRHPGVEILIEIRDEKCFVCTEVVPGKDARRDASEPAAADAAGEPQVAPRFLVDAMLGTLATRLRALGFDTEWRRDTADSLLLREANEQGRVVLTQDRELAEIGGRRSYLVRGKTVESQLADVIERFRLELAEERLFTRCSLCNAVLAPVEKQAVAERVPRRAFAQHTEFWRCPACDKIYWKGSHYEDMRRLLESSRPAAK
jgi:uncharacterized protein with PIN domain/tRNA(Ser,Leu) C12 N-acetylase TAN1